ncbi:MAG: zinc ribbon domain-containing protein [Chthonomonas sp.]|nr:zinc ribbon domain-containing protein [Chthonomonas sp.]
MKRCPQCQSFNAVDAKFCSNCGANLAGPAATYQTPQVSRPVMTPTARRAGWPLAIAVLLGIVAIGFGSAGLLKAVFKPSSSGVTQATAQPASGLTQAQAAPESGITKAPAPSRTRMPEDVRQYLLHVEATEKQRRQIALKHLGVVRVKMTELMAGGGLDALKDIMNSDPLGEDPKSPADKLKVDFAAMRSDWRAVLDFLNTKTPPGECQALHDSYDQSVRETGAQILNLLDILDHASSDPASAVSTLEGMKGASKDIEQAARKANDEVESICQRYDERAWFSISDDFGGDGGMLKSMGGL